MTLVKPGFFASQLFQSCVRSAAAAGRDLSPAASLTPAQAASYVVAAADEGLTELAFGANGRYRKHGPTQTVINACPAWLARRIRGWRLAAEKRGAAAKAAAAAAAAVDIVDAAWTAAPVEQA